MLNLRISRVDIKPKGILKKKGLTKHGKATHILLSELERLGKKYIPENKKSLKTMVTVTDEFIHYRSIYAQYLWHGKVMIGNAPKKVINKDLKFQKGRQKEWALVAWDNHKSSIINVIERNYK